MISTGRGSRTKRDADHADHRRTGRGSRGSRTGRDADYADLRLKRDPGFIARVLFLSTTRVPFDRSMKSKRSPKPARAVAGRPPVFPAELPRARATALALITFTVVFVALQVGSYTRTSATFDEPGGLAAGYAALAVARLPAGARAPAAHAPLGGAAASDHVRRVVRQQGARRCQAGGRRLSGAVRKRPSLSLCAGRCPRLGEGRRSSLPRALHERAARCRAGRARLSAGWPSGWDSAPPSSRSVSIRSSPTSLRTPRSSRRTWVSRASSSARSIFSGERPATDVVEHRRARRRFSCSRC